MTDILIMLVTLGVTLLAVGIIYLYDRARTVEIDINEGIDPAIDGPIEMQRLREDPEKLEELRGKVTQIVFNGQVSNHKDGVIAESWIIDSNGATITLETTREGPDAPGTLGANFSSRTGSDTSVEGGSFFPNPVAERNVRIEENARWLAEQLDVPFED